MTWVQIVNDYLKKNKCDCLKNYSKRCYCKVDHLFICAFDAGSFCCEPGKVKAMEKEFCTWLDEVDI
jgi:hypothetical protein